MNPWKAGLSNPEANAKKYRLVAKSGAPKELGTGRWKWQLKAFNDLRKARFGLLSAFCGSGKTAVEIALAIDDFKRTGNKQLIVVPQSHLADNFTKDRDRHDINIRIGNQIHSWLVLNNYCDATDGKVVARLKNWLLTDSNKLRSTYNAVCTHQALGLVWISATAPEKRRMIKNLTLRVDEAHHVSGVFDLTEEGLDNATKNQMAQEATNLGDISRAIVNSPDPRSKLHLCTATFYRGDQAAILSPAVADKFKSHYLDWLDHWKTLGLKNFETEFEFYETDPIKRIIHNIRREPKEKHIIVIPSKHQKWRTNGKEYRRLLAELCKLYPQERVLDLVTVDGRDARIERLRREPKRADQKSEIDVVVVCMIGREGMDWVPCSRLHNASPEKSITLAVQTMGRVFRRFEDENGFAVKNRVRIINYIEKFVKPTKDMTLNEVLTDRLNAVLFLMQVDEMIHPLIVPTLTGRRKGRPLSEHFGSEYQKMKGDLLRQVENIDAVDKISYVQSVNDIVGGILDEYEIEENRAGISQGLQNLIVRAKLPSIPRFEIDVAFIRNSGFPGLVEKHDLHRKNIFFRQCSHKQFKDIRKLTQDVWWKKTKKALQFKGACL